ncbi:MULTISPECIES: hypothetical protein [unclassified Bradyrhizobium]|uniref:hypothetical protein n=1 Tax=unclassified Bradyrhizobium TaxID=2631580 RepID=UPI002916C196|nr:MULTISPECIES: hypothetical protein [unclassified Bradyrhizobium]
MIDGTIMDEYQWVLPSSSGRERFCGSFIRSGRSSDGPDVLLTRIALLGEFWPQPPFDKEAGRADWETEPQFCLSFPKVIIRRDRIDCLRDQLQEWFADYRAISVNLSKITSVDASIEISIGVNDRLISSAMQPAFTFSYKWRSIAVEESFVVDQSCIRIFCEGLSFGLSAVQK